MTEASVPPLTVTQARVMPTPQADPVVGDLHVAGGAFVAARARDHGHVIDARGAYAVPLLVDSALAARTPSEAASYDLVPGNPATFALIRRPVSEAQIRRMLVVNPADLRAVVVAGHVEVRDGRETRVAGEDLRDPAARAAWVGTWDDPRRDMQQHLSADGRYSETRGGRADAYTGRFWVRQNRITYLDDSGFWAFGELVDGVLHHAGFVLTRA